MIITEYRWKCDWCGAVSPAQKIKDKAPYLWRQYIPFLDHPVAGSLIHITKVHFCCQQHLDEWKAKHP